LLKLNDKAGISFKLKLTIQIQHLLKLNWEVIEYPAIATQFKYNTC
jgi:hypothetical protein